MCCMSFKRLHQLAFKTPSLSAGQWAPTFVERPCDISSDCENPGPSLERRSFQSDLGVPVLISKNAR
jgi:hypothetical protein